MSPPTFVRFNRAWPDTPETVRMEFMGEDGQQYSATLTPNTLPALIAGLIASANTLGAGNAIKGAPAIAQPIDPIGFNIGADEKGFPILFFQLGPGLALPVRVPRERLPQIRSLISNLEGLMESPPPDKAKN